MTTTPNKFTSELLAEITKRTTCVLYKLKDGIWTAKCPFCGDAEEKFQVNEKRAVYHCFKCHSGGGLMHIKRDFQPITK